MSDLNISTELVEEMRSKDIAKIRRKKRVEKNKSLKKKSYKQKRERKRHCSFGSIWAKEHILELDHYNTELQEKFKVPVNSNCACCCEAALFDTGGYISETELYEKHKTYTESASSNRSYLVTHPPHLPPPMWD